MRRLFHFILSHSIFISFCAAALCFQTIDQYSKPQNGFMLAFVFFATIAGYNGYWMTSMLSFNRYDSIAAFLVKSKSSFFVLLAASVCTFYCMAKLDLIFTNIFITVILFALYTLPVLPFKQLIFLRKFGVLKTFILAFTWAIITTLVPLQISLLQIGNVELLIIVNRFLFMLMICIIFDSRDAAVDKIRGLKTLATGINPVFIHYLTGAVFLGYAFTSYKMKSYGIAGSQVIALLLTGLITLLVYYNSLQKRGYMFYYFLVDGLMFLSAMLCGLAGVLI